MARDAAPPRQAALASVPAGDAEATLEAALAVVESHVRVVQGRVESVREACAALEHELATRRQLAPACCERLAAAAAGRRSPCSDEVRAFLLRRAATDESPAVPVACLLRASAGRQTIDAALDVVQKRRLAVDAELLASLEVALRVIGTEPDAALLERVADLAGEEGNGAAAGPPAALERLLTPGNAAQVRRLAARVLDHSGSLPRPELARLLLGPDCYSRFAPLLDFTRASHADLVALTHKEEEVPTPLAAIERACVELGTETTGRFIAALGWPSVSHGLWVRRLIGLSVSGSFPFLVEPAEARLLEACGPSRRLLERDVVIAYGGQPGGDEGGAGVDTIRRFRAYNLAHAELLGEILAVEPLTRSKARRILDLTDRVVDDFVALFGEHDEESSRVRAVYAPLRERIESACSQVAAEEPLPIEATREVQAFEDPRALYEVRTLHGLKRFLHQRGLRNAFRLFRAGSATNRTVDIAIAAPGGVVEVVRPIRYIDFEPLRTDGRPPYVIALLVEAFLFQLVHGVRDLPTVEALIFGNEIQIYVRYRNHPAFLRLDLSPPLRGGVIDLEYFAVSQYDMSQHPNIELPAVQCFLGRLGCLVDLDGFRLHARYDKEQARDLAELLDVVCALFRLLPYLMDLDWTIGSLDYPPSVRQKLAEAWSELFASWGVLPLDQLLTANRRSVLVSLERGAGAEREVRWDGRGQYRGRFTQGADQDLPGALRRVLQERGLALEMPVTGGAPMLGQRWLERTVLAPLRDAVAAGQLEVRRGELVAAAAGSLRREHEAVYFANLLATRGEPLVGAIRLAGQLRSMERHLLFQSSGTLNGFPVERATFAIEGETATLFTLRDGQGVVRLLVAVRGTRLLVRSGCNGRAAPVNLLEGADLMTRLRRSNFLTTGDGADPSPADDAVAAVVTVFAAGNPLAPGHADRDDRVARGVSACPGRAAGPARFDVRPAAAALLDGAVLVAAAIGPSDAPLLRRAAALVSTGGGVLSHLGTVALELGKPSVMVAGRWEAPPGGSPTLLLRRLEFEEEERSLQGFEVSCWTDRCEHEEAVREGDLLVVDGDMGLVWLLGGDREALALHSELQQLRAAAAEMTGNTSEEQALSRRGRLLRASHALGRLAWQTTRPGLARYLAWELLLDLAQAGPATTERQRVLARLLENTTCGDTAALAAGRLVVHLRSRFSALAAEATQVIPRLESPHEIAYLRLGVLRLACALEELGHLGFADEKAEAPDAAAALVEETARRGLERVKAEVASALAASSGDRRWRRRHLRETASLVERLLGEHGSTTKDRPPPPEAGRVVVRCSDGGAELAGEVGAKAANLGELVRILGPACVPPWFAVTDHAFRLALATRVNERMGPSWQPGRASGQTLGGAITAVLEREEMDAARQAAAIRSLWRTSALPPEVASAVLAAYGTLSHAADVGDADPGAAAMVAVRSSGREEDTEAAAWAGQFDTFLYVSGEEALLEHLKLAWAGMWSERALHQRRSVGASGAGVGGGVIVQRMINARVAGVLHTVSAATGQVREMVINVGLGLGEGVVSGAVEVDQVFVSKDTDPFREPLRLRYLVGDKRTKMVFDDRRGRGTCCRDTLFHQRMRPALEYAELSELVQAAAQLEAVYRQPLDIEFGYEGSDLYMLQVRPVPVFRCAVEDTVARFPLRPVAAVRQEVTS